MRKLITAVTLAALLASAAAPAALARGGQRHHGTWHGTAYYAGSYFKPWPYYGYRYRRHRYRHGGAFYFRGDGAVILGVLAGAAVLGALLSRPPVPRSPPVLRSSTGAPLGGCLRTTGTGTWYGRPARFSGTLCYDPAGRAYVLPGSARFAGYLR